jgi:hypothetical protein
MYASFLGISEALHLDVFHQPLRRRFFDSLVRKVFFVSAAGGKHEPASPKAIFEGDAL